MLAPKLKAPEPQSSQQPPGNPLRLGGRLSQFTGFRDSWLHGGSQHGTWTYLISKSEPSEKLTPSMRTRSISVLPESVLIWTYLRC